MACCMNWEDAKGGKWVVPEGFGGAWGQGGGQSKEVGG